MKKITSIVLTGGPCAGKSKSIIELKNNLSKYGYRVIIIPEIATEIRANGFLENIDKVAFQKMIFEMQLFKENLYRNMILKNNDYSKTILILDRGLMDNKIYLSDEEFEELICEKKLTIESIFARYTAVYHLDSTAIQNNNSYEKSSNEYRLFTPTVAKKLNDSGIQVWKAHPNFYRISVEENFERKLQKLNKSVLELLLNRN